jgi:hypothetical protein
MEIIHQELQLAERESSADITRPISVFIRGIKNPDPTKPMGAAVNIKLR